MRNNKTKFEHCLVVAIVTGPLLLSQAACEKKSKNTDPAASSGTAADPAAQKPAGGGSTTEGAGSGGSTAGTATETISTTPGTLALTGIVGSTGDASEASLNLTESNATMGCQIEGQPDTLITAEIDATTGEFSFTAEQVKPFIGNVVSCSITLADGSVNYLKSFSIPEDAVAADVTATYDAESGAVNDKAEVTKADGNSYSSDEVYAPLPAALMAFDPTGITGEYSRKNCEIDRSSADNSSKIKAVKKGDLAGTGLDANCEGWEQQGLYLRGEKGVAGSAEPLVQDLPPTLAMWNRKADYDACHVNGALAMAVSDGTNTFNFGNGEGIAAEALYDAIAANSWAPQVALDRATAANPEDAPVDNESAGIRTTLVATYGENPCAGFGADLAKDWANPAIGIVKRAGRGYCDGTLRYNTPVAQMNEMLNQEIEESQDSPGEGGFRDLCGEYKKAKTDEGRANAVGKFVTMCTNYLAGKPGEREENQAKIELVDAFTRSIGELKWQTGDTRFDGLKNALKGLNLDTPSGISTDALKALGQEWMLVSWDWRARRILEYAVASMESIISTANDSWLGIDGKTGREAIVAMLADSETRNNLDMLVCADQWAMNTLPAMIGETATTNMEAALDAPSQSNNFSSTWKSTVSEADRKALAIAFIDGFLTKNVDHCERVKLVNQRSQINSYTSSSDNNWNPIDQFPQMMFGHQLLEAKKRKKMDEVAAHLHDANVTYATLKTDVTDLAAFNMGGQDWMSQEIQRIEEKHSDEAGRLYRLKQMLGGEAARSAFRYDATYLAKMQEIKEASSCLPDAKVDWQGQIDDEGNQVNNLVVTGPVKQIMKAPLSLNNDVVKAVDTRLENGGDCYWGNVNGFTAIPVSAFASASGFTSPYMMAWFNGCGGSGGGSSEDALNGMFTVSKLTPVTNQ